MYHSAEEKQLGPRLGVSLWLLAFIFFSAITLAILNTSNIWNPFTIYATLSWSFGIPIIVMSFIGAVGSRSIKISNFKGRVDSPVIFVVPSIGSLGVYPALRRVLDSIIKFAPLNLDNWRIDLILEEWSEAKSMILEEYSGKNVNVILVPKDYATKNGSINKSRALQYGLEYRVSRGEGNSGTWIFHLDDDASIGPDTVAAIAEHIKFKGKRYLLAQGVLAFPHDHSNSTIAKFADSMRPTDDLTRFYFFTALLKTPLVGLHGENLLVRSDVECEIGWDSGNRPISDDSCFGLNFSKKYPGRSSFLPAFTYGASPASVMDMLKQRRRWLVDLTNLGLYGPLPWRYRLLLIYSVIFWSSMVTQNVILIVLILQLLHVIAIELITVPMAVMWSFTFSFWIWFYWNGLHINNEVSERKEPFWKKALLMIPLFFFVIGPLEAFGGAWGIYAFLRNERKFEVIKKPA
ncbi:glycosyltransferase family 2 protein [Thermoplasmatales archaeon AK]|nr:glycosyltransferase family 2 protein [Thermoplasmatales archaeon AK]